MNTNQPDPPDHCGNVNSDVVEHCWTLVGWHKSPLWYAELVRPTTGEPTTVDFDGQWVLEREEQHGDVVGFLHTHPSGTPDPSGRDLKTMRAWVSCFGKPLLCLIETDDELTAYLFTDDECQGQQLELAQRLTDNSLVLYEDHYKDINDHDE